jgi:hypothetical protein
MLFSVSFDLPLQESKFNVRNSINILVPIFIFRIVGNVFGYGFVADKSARIFRRNSKLVNTQEFPSRKFRRNEL